MKSWKLGCLGLPLLAILSGCAMQLRPSSFLHPGYVAMPSKLLPQIETNGYTATSMFFPATDGTRLHGLLLTNPHANVTVMVYSGNGFRLGRAGLERARVFEHAGVNAFLFEYRGYGESEGKTTLATLVPDALNAFDYVRGLPQLRHQPIVVFGVSLGSFVAPKVALQRKVAGLVLASTATDVVAWSHSIVPWYEKPFVRIDISPSLLVFNNSRNLQGYDGPLLLLAGAKDTLTHPKFAHQLFRTSATPADEKMLYESPDEGHAEILEDPNGVKALARFIHAVVLPHAQTQVSLGAVDVEPHRHSQALRAAKKHRS